MDELITALNQSIKIVRALQKDVRFLAAEEELKALEQRIDTGLSSGALHEGSPQLDQLRAAIDKLNVKELRNRCRRIRDALAESDSKLTDDWTLGSHMFGVTTHYRHESDGNVLLRIEALQENLPFFDLVAVGFEVPLFKSWIPLCNGSDLIERLARTEFVAKIDFYTPFPFMLSREAYMHIFVAECLQEHSKVVALCRSVESNAIPGVTIPPAAPTVLHNRLDLKTMKFVFDLSSPSSARVVVICKFDLKLFVPQPLLNFIVTKCMGVFLYFMQKKAIEIHHSTSGPYVDRVKSNPEFYMDWIVPKLFNFFRERGWGRPTLPLYLQDEVEKRFPLCKGNGLAAADTSTSTSTSTNQQESGPSDGTEVDGSAETR